jgi:hypothetical protein
VVLGGYLCSERGLGSQTGRTDGQGMIEKLTNTKVKEREPGRVSK